MAVAHQEPAFEFPLLSPELQEYHETGFPISWKTSRENGLCRLQLLQLTSALHARRSGMRSSQFNIRASLLTLIILLLCSAFSLAQAAPKYDASTEAKFKGTIEEMKIPPKGKEKEIAYVTIKSGTDTFEIYLCPKSYIDDMGVIFAKGDEIAFTGSKVKQGDADMILAREVVKGSDTLILRDDKGKPVWDWKH
jgi:hypothetical protein